MATTEFFGAFHEFRQVGLLRKKSQKLRLRLILRHEIPRRCFQGFAVTWVRAIERETVIDLGSVYSAIHGLATQLDSRGLQSPFECSYRVDQFPLAVPSPQRKDLRHLWKS